MNPQVIVAGTGRDGTASLHHYIAELYAHENKGKQACHEFASREIYNCLDKLWHSRDSQDTSQAQAILLQLKTLIKNCPYEAIIGNGYAFAFAKMTQLFPKKSRFIHLKRRDREACIRSLINCNQFFPEANGHYSSQADVDFQVWRTSAFHLDEMSKQAWDEWTIEQKFEWYYDRSHHLLDEMSRYFTHSLDVYTEDISDPDKLLEIADFLQITPPEAPIQCVRKNSFVYAEAAQIDAFYLPKAQWFYLNFDFPRSVENELLPIDYFCERFISWNSKLLSHEEKDELARYDLPLKEMLSKVRSGKAILQKWQEVFQQLEMTVISKIKTRR